jgi:hypothetical protein
MCLTSHIRWMGLTLCAKILFNMIFVWLPHLCTPHIQLSVGFLSRAGNFKHIFNHKDQGGFPSPCKEGHLLVDLKKECIQYIEYPFEYGEAINYTLDGVLIHSVTTNIFLFYQARQLRTNSYLQWRPTPAKPLARLHWANWVPPHGTPKHGQLWYSLELNQGM